VDITSTHAGFTEHGATTERRPFIFRRPVAKTGIVSWLTTVDHKRIGLLYGISGLFFFIVGGIEALLIRYQLAVPNNDAVSFERFNQLFTMHGTTMIFLAVMPMGSALFNYIMPLQIGARDVAFPRLNAFAYWVFLAGAIIINLGWFIPSGPPDTGWYGYAPLTLRAFSDHIPGDMSVDLWAIGLQILGVSSIVGSLNFIVTIINLRAPGLTMMRLPVFTWMTLVTSFLVIMAFPAITIALLELTFDRMVHTSFFDVSNGGLPILWQHLFWVFGHPEVYILILPAMGVISEVIPTFARKPLFGYPIVVFSGATIGFIGFGVWAHHMFTTGMGTIATTAFALATMAIAVPTGVKMFNWIGTLWNGQIRLRTPMMFALGFLWMFMIGGFSGVMHSAAAHDTQQNDTYFVVAHFHYVLIGGSVFAILAGMHYWLPLVFGRRVPEGVGKLSFWITFVGFNLTFFPMHFLGLNGMPRRIATYGPDMGWSAGNLISSVGAFILATGLGVYLTALIYAVRKGPVAGHDPWDARTLEWSVPHPPPEYNFAATPRVRARDDYWHRKHHPERAAEEEKMAAQESAEGIHMPSQSWFPFTTALGILSAAIFLCNHRWDGAVGSVAVMVLSIYCWALEGPGGYHVHPKVNHDSTSHA
jgi:cytochrome c oxidase subunit 1